MKRHAIPSTLTSTGRVVQTWLPGPAEALTGWRRTAEIWHRFRQKRSRLTSVRLTFAAWRHGVALSGHPERTIPPRSTP